VSFREDLAWIYIMYIDIIDYKLGDPVTFEPQEFFELYYQNRAARSFPPCPSKKSSRSSRSGIPWPGVPKSSAKRARVSCYFAIAMQVRTDFMSTLATAVYPEYSGEPSPVIGRVFVAHPDHVPPFWAEQSRAEQNVSALRALDCARSGEIPTSGKFGQTWGTVPGG